MSSVAPNRTAQAKAGKEGVFMIMVRGGDSRSRPWMVSARGIRLPSWTDFGRANPGLPSGFRHAPTIAKKRNSPPCPGHGTPLGSAPIVPPHTHPGTARGRALRASLLLLPMAPLSGCCSLARLFCGPDRAPWVSVRWREPRDTVRTVLEAVRRADTRVLYDALGDAYKKRLGIDSEMTMDQVWKILQDRVTGIHLLGYGEIRHEERLAPDRGRFVVEASGHQVQITVVAAAFQEVWLDRGEGMKEYSEYLSSLSDALTGPDGDRGTLTVRIASRRFAGVPPEQIREVRAGYEWKVDDLMVPQS